MAAASTARTRLSRSELDVTSSGGVPAVRCPPVVLADTFDRSMAGGMVHSKQPPRATKRGGIFAGCGTLPGCVVDSGCMATRPSGHSRDIMRESAPLPSAFHPEVHSFAVESDDVTDGQQ